jgi:hypothetical protein
MCTRIAAWQELRDYDPDLAAHGERLVRPDGDGTAYLATVRKAGGPRVHPVMPVVADAKLYVFVLSFSPKHAALLRDGRYALHSSQTMTAARGSTPRVAPPASTTPRAEPKSPPRRATAWSTTTSRRCSSSASSECSTRTGTAGARRIPGRATRAGGRRRSRETTRG